MTHTLGSIFLTTLVIVLSALANDGGVLASDAPSTAQVLSPLFAHLTGPSRCNADSHHPPLFAEGVRVRNRGT